MKPSEGATLEPLLLDSFDVAREKVGGLRAVLADDWFSLLPFFFVRPSQFKRML